MGKEVLPAPPGAPERMPGMVSGVRAGGFLFFSAIRERNPPARIAVQVADANAAPGGKAHFALDVIALAA